MKPFDLEAAKRGELLYHPLNGKASFIGLKRDGTVVYEINGWMGSRKQIDIFMAPKTRTVWVNFYPYPEERPESTYFNSQEDADTADTIMNMPRLGDKAYPVEIEE